MHRAADWQWQRVALLGWAAVLIGPVVVRAEDWPQWRGPRLNGVSQESHLPAKWSRTENVLWRLPLPGPGGATPVIWGDRIFLTSAEEGNVVLMCVSTDGTLQWKRVIGSGDEFYRSDEGNDASPSPSTDGRHVWATTSKGNLACYTVAGERVWEVDLQSRYGEFDIQFGLSSTPVLDGDRLYLQLIHGAMDQQPADGALVLAIDKTTGKEVWRHLRQTDAVMENKHSYASPVLYRDDQREYLLSHGGDYIIAHRLQDGAELWRCGGLNPKENYNPFLRFVASPVVVPGCIVVPTAKRGPVLGLRPDLTGDVTDQPAARRWKAERMTPDVASPLVHDGLVYLAGEAGDNACLDASTGETVYLERAVKRRRQRASPVYADGKVFFVARDEGVVTVVRAGRKYDVLAVNTLGEPLTASPAIAGGRIYLRTFDALYAIGD